MKRTKKLKESEYKGIPFDLHESIHRHVNQEEKLWYPHTVQPLSKYEKQKIKRSTGMLNFIKSSVTMFIP